MAEGARLESVCGGYSTAGSNPALSAIVSTEPSLELGPCASSSFEPCQARKGAALRGNSASAAGCPGSMLGSFFAFVKRSSEGKNAEAQRGQMVKNCPGCDSAGFTS